MSSRDSSSSISSEVSNGTIAVNARASGTGRGCASVVSFLVLALMAACRGESGLVAIDVGGHEFLVEVARTAEERRVGLMNRDQIPERGGMLFVFDDSDYRSFWMKDTAIPLSIAFIGANGTIQEIHQMEPFSLERVNSRSPARYALEVRRGTFADLGIGPGDRVRLPEVVTSRSVPPDRR